MKFQCDRCKTRYSIADEKVRGKVLKIRCKNCTAVITVKDETPAVVADPLPSSSALEGAFQRAMSQISTEASPNDSEPTRIGAMPSFEPGASAGAGAANDHEWYVSVDGNQEGPFRLDEARRRVSRRKRGEELYGWREGFEDWLLVDKIPDLVPPAPPRPDSQPRARRLSVPPIPADAGLMRGGAAAVASPLPKSASGPVATAALPPPSDGEASAPAQPVNLDGSSANAERRSPEVMSMAALAAGPSALEASNSAGSSAAKGGSAGAVAGKEGEAPPTADNLDFEIGEASRVVRMPALPPPGGLAERKPLAARAGLPGVGARNGSVLSGVDARGSGPAAAVRATSASEALAAASLKPVPPPPKRSRAALYLAAGGGLVAASILVMSLIVLFRRGDGDEEGSGRGGSTNRFESDFYNSTGLGGSRGPMVVTKSDGSGGRGGDGARARSYGPRPTLAPPGQPVLAKPPEIPTTPLPQMRSAPIGPTVREGDDKFNKADSFSEEEEPETIEPLKPEDVRAAYRSNQAGMKWCYEHALKNDPEMKVSRVDVTITINPAGVVSNVSLPIANTYLGGCLRDRIRSWRFRKSTEGLQIEFPLIFAQRG